ncbi:MAG TPA: serine hydrolase domain-containing protein, partial [Candidatus Acidoferrales bacterium]|nr:serine hydrolase domain-containing protein [Candidatus Acidoferrales bacterium]
MNADKRRIKDLPLRASLLSAAFICIYLWFPPSFAWGQNAPSASAPAPKLAALDPIVEKSIAADEIPGAVLLVGHRGRVIFRKAYGARALLPQREAMTVDTVFDLASLTKVVATTSAVMKLLEQGKVRLNDPIARYLPEFSSGKQEGKGQVTLRQLLTHTAGLSPIPRNIAEPGGAEQVLQAIYDDTLVSPPGSRFLYSDSGFILLGELVRSLSGAPLDEFVARNIFAPLGMAHTRFRPPAEWLPRVAPTEEIDLPEVGKAGSGRGRVLRGVVHDPRARSMGGVAGHAGLFSTAGDLAVFCQMLLAGGVGPNGRRIFAAATLRKMTA